ncbi:MAG: VanZ family protein [Lachnospiraceae bacterium]|jgi:VanZ family protein|nr:VanZ family protein [Lachnospiraceae bacterium]
MKYIGLFIKKLLRYLLKPLSFLPAIVVMYLIFSFSSQDGVSSARLSRMVSEKVVVTADQVLEKGWSAEQIAAYTEQIHYYVRKTAHVTEYFVLAVTVAFPLYVYGIRGLWLVLLAGVFCVSFAGLDEYHQSFVAGRGPSARDVAVDSIGILPGILLVRIVGFIGRKTIFRPLALHKK